MPSDADSGGRDISRPESARLFRTGGKPADDEPIY
jgi:hypothetical protein